MGQDNPSRTISSRRTPPEKCPHNRAAAERLDRAMTEAGVSNRELSERSGLSESDVSRMRRGERWVHSRLIEALPEAARLDHARGAVEASGARVIRLAGPVRCRPMDYAQAVGSVLCETGDVSVSVSHAVADGRVTPDEARDVRREIKEAIDALLILDARLATAQTTGGELLPMVAGGAE